MDQPATNPRAAPSAALTWAPLRAFVAGEARLAARAAAAGPVAAGVYEFLRFGLKQAWACLFGGIMLALLIGTHFWYPAGAPLARYDFLFLAALAVQGGLLLFRLETLEEAQVILAYHVVGTLMEVFKTGVGSWSYPEPSLFHIAGVPLFTGFMYSCIGSYICRAWRLFHARFTRHPPVWALAALSVAVYANFYADNSRVDFRWVLIAATALLFARTRFYFVVWRRPRSMPILLGLFLVAVFVWFAENIGTLTQTWIYPQAHGAWAFTGVTKLGSWFLLLVISYTLVALIKRDDLRRPYVAGEGMAVASSQEGAATVARSEG